MSIDMFATREMTRALRQLYTVRTWLRDFIFNNTETHNSQYVDIDVEKGGRMLAPYVSPLHEGKKVDRDGFTAETFKTPYSKPKMVSTAQDFLRRKPGQTVYESTDTSGARAQEQLGKDLRKMSEMLDRLEEHQCAQALQTGKVIVKGEGVDAEIDFGFAAEQLPVLAGTNLWSDLTNSDPIKDISGWFEDIDRRAGLIPANAIFGRLAMQNFLRGTKTKSLLDNRRIKLGQIDPDKFKDIGVRYYGYLDDPGLDLWTYTAWYFDETTGVLSRYIDDDKVIMWGQGARATRHYGAIEDLENFAVVERFAKSWITKDPSARWIMLQSAPLCVPHQVDAFMCATVL